MGSNFLGQDDMEELATQLRAEVDDEWLMSVSYNRADFPGLLLKFGNNYKIAVFPTGAMIETGVPRFMRPFQPKRVATVTLLRARIAGIKGDSVEDGAAIFHAWRTHRSTIANVGASVIFPGTADQTKGLASHRKRLESGATLYWRRQKNAVLVLLDRTGARSFYNETKCTLDPQLVSEALAFRALCTAPAMPTQT